MRFFSPEFLSWPTYHRRRKSAPPSRCFATKFDRPPFCFQGKKGSLSLSANDALWWPPRLLLFSPTRICTMECAHLPLFCLPLTREHLLYIVVCGILSTSSFNTCIVVVVLFSAPILLLFLWARDKLPKRHQSSFEILAPSSSTDRKKGNQHNT